MCGYNYGKRKLLWIKAIDIVLALDIFKAVLRDAMISLACFINKLNNLLIQGNNRGRVVPLTARRSWVPCPC